MESPLEERLHRVSIHAEQNRRLTQHRHFFSYAWNQIRHAPLYEGWLSILAFFRRARLLLWIFRIGTALLALIEAGTVVLLSLLVSLVLLPLMLALIPGFLLAVLIETRREDRRLSKELIQKQCVVLFLPAEKTSFFAGWVRELSKKENCTVLLVSPYLLSGKGFSGDRFYAVLRRETDEILLIRRHYFVHLKRRRLLGNDAIIII